VKPAPFKYLAADSAASALALKAEHGEEARFLAGGQSLIPAMNFRLAQPEVLIDINPAHELSYMKEETGSLRIGALTRNRALERDPIVAKHQPLVREAIAHVAHPQIRNRGTLAGNLAHADPASEMPAVMLALGARMKARSARGERWIAARDFFTGIFSTALAADELLAEIELPALPPRTGCAFLEVARRRGDYAMMGVAAVVTLDDDGVCEKVRLAYCSAGPTPMLVESDSLEVDIQKAIDPLGSVQASKAFQRHLAGVLTRRAVALASERALAPASSGISR
jgi:aerobic carbon-monoxide dehydrogenase medium subunit